MRVTKFLCRGQVRPIRCVLVLATAGQIACDSSPHEESPPEKDELKLSGAPAPKQLYIPEVAATGEHVDLDGNEHSSGNIVFGPPPPPGMAALPFGTACGPEMVLVAGTFCIDRYEISLVDSRDGRELSPHYPPTQEHTSSLFERWSRKAGASGRGMDGTLSVPLPPSFQLLEKFAPRGRSVQGVLPAGYLTRGLAEAACKNAGKRLCERQEWVRACRGEADTQFPYGSEYRDGVCNVHRKHHPAGLLHGNSSKNHLDPRLGLTMDEDGTLLRTTGETSTCVSRWGNDGIYDMVGNVDEWIAEPTGSFLGGFFSRGTKEGCASSIDSHDPGYMDYSLGSRCCNDL